MKRMSSRHHTEEELLMHYLHEETPAMEKEIAGHLAECDECTAVFQEYADLVVRIQSWPVPQIAEETWRNQKRVLLAHYREDVVAGKRKGIVASLQKSLATAWGYALENPLPTLAYIAVAIAFALERTITTFRLDRVLPGASQVFEFLRQVF